MEVLLQLFSSDSGLLSLAALAGVLGIAAFFFWYVMRHMKADSARADKPR